MKTARFSPEQLTQLLEEADFEHEEVLSNIENLNYLTSHEELRDDPKYWKAMEHIRSKLRKPPYGR